MPTRGRHFLFPSAKKGLDKPAPAGYNNTIVCGFSSSGRAPPCQGGGSEFESRNPLQQKAQGEMPCAFLFVVSLRKTRTGQSDRIATVRGTVAVPACVPVRAEAHRASLVIRSNKKSKAFCLAFFVLQYCETRTGQPVRVATVRGTVAVPACVPVRAEAHRASLVIRSNKESKAFCLAFFILQLLRDSNRAIRQDSNSPGDCCDARVHAGAHRSAPHFAHHTPPRLWPNLPAPPYLAALQGCADLLQ